MADPLLVAGAVLAAGVACAHSLLGEKYILRPLLGADLPAFPAGRKFSRRTIRFAWHLTSVAWAGFGWIMLLPDNAESLLHKIGAVFLVSAVVTLVASRGRHLAWIVFAVIGTLAWMGGNQYAP